MAGTGETGEKSRTRVFLSYSRGDRERAKQVIAGLEHAEIEVWWDGLLTGGDTFLQTTEEVLETSDAVVVLWTATSVNSHWVRDEATRGRERNCLVPVNIDDSTPPLGFRQIHFVNLVGWNGKPAAPELAELVRAVQQVAASGTQEVGPAAMPSRTVKHVPVGSRRAWMIGAGAVAVLGGGLASWRLGLLGDVAETNSIAVMPFRNLSADAGKNYLSDGLAEELRAMLSLNPEVQVSAQSSSNSLRDANLTMTGIASKLGVAYVLEGSVQTEGDKLRIVTRMIDGSDGFQKWSQVFDRKLTDLLTVQNEIATMVTDALVSTMLAGEKKKGERVGGTSNANAFDAYLRGRALFALAQDETSDRQALAAYEEAIRFDPRYALAHAARASALLVISGSYASGAEVPRLNAEALVEAKKAVELAPDLTNGHSALGFYLYGSELDLAAAKQPMERSLELGFGDAGVLVHYALFAAYLCEFDKARDAVKRAKRLDPLNANVWRTSSSVEFMARDYTKAEEEARVTLSKNRKINVVNRILGDIALIRGDIAAAEGYFKAEPSSLSRLRGIAITAFRRDDRVSAQQKLDELVAEFGSNSLYQQAQIFAQWGDPAKALDALERGYDVRDAGMAFAPSDPLLDPVRKDRRFVAVLTKLGVDATRVSTGEG